MTTEETVQRWPDAEFETSNPNQLGDILKSVGVLVEEIQVNIDYAGLSVKQMDSNHYAMVDLSVDSYEFDQFNVVRPGVFGFNLSETLKLVWKKKFVKNAMLKTTVEEKNLIFEIQDQIKRRKSVALLEPLEEELPEPKIYYKAKIRMSADVLRIVDDVQVSEHMTIKANSDRIVFESKGDMGEESFSLERVDENLLDLNVDGSQEATYDLNYLRDIAKGLKPLCDVIEIEFSTDMPIRITGEVNFSGHLIYYLAPCIGV